MRQKTESSLAGKERLSWIKSLKDWRNIVLLISSLSFVFGAAEIGTRLLWAEPTHGTYQLQSDSLSMTPNTEGVYSSSEFEFKVNSNRFGRRDWEWTQSVIDEPCSVVFTGDSFVFGYGVNDPDTVPSRLEAELEESGRKEEVFNFGAGGALPEYRKNTERAISQGFRAQSFIVGIFLGNDLTNEPVYVSAQAAETSLLRMPSLSDSKLYQFLKLRASSSTRVTGLVFRLGRLLNRDIYPTGTGYIFLRQWTPAQSDLFYSLLKETLEIAKVGRSNGRNLMFVIFPNRIQVENSKDLTSSVYDPDLPDKRILDFCSENGLSCLDLLPVLRSTYEEKQQPLFFPVDRHMNPAGNRVAAKAIRDYLRDKKMLCGPAQADGSSRR